MTDNPYSSCSTWAEPDLDSLSRRVRQLEKNQLSAFWVDAFLMAVIVYVAWKDILDVPSIIETIIGGF